MIPFDRRYFLFLACFVLFIPDWIAAQETSRIVYRGDDGCLEYVADGDNNYISDFSHSGYRAGEAPLPDYPVVMRIEAVAGDNTANIQSAIDAMKDVTMNAEGIRGALLLEAGTYNVSGVLKIEAGGIVLRGVGQGADPTSNTIIRATGNNPKGRNLIVVGGVGSPSWDRARAGTRSAVTSEFLPAGSRSLSVANPELYGVGDNVIVNHPGTDAWLASINYGGTDDDAGWKPGEIDIIYNRRITDVNAPEGKITLDAPIFDHFERALAQAEVYVLDDPNTVREAGVENLRIEVVTAGEEDEEHAKTCIYLNGVENVWVKDVTGLHFSYALVDMSRANQVSVVGCSGLEPHSQVTGSRRYNFNVSRESNNVLFEDCTASNGRHSFVSNGTSSAAGIVWHASQSSGDFATSEGHRRWSQGLLYDSITFADPQTTRLLGLYNRGDYGTGHGWSATNSVAWNVRMPAANQLIIQRPPGRLNYSVGSFGQVNGGGPFPQPAGYIELNDKDLAIPSLYNAQLAQRLGQGVAPDAPARLRVTADDGGVKLSWLDIASRETGYVVSISNDGGDTYTLLAALPPNSITYTHDTGTAGNPNVVYRVSAGGANCGSPFSNPARVVVAPVEAIFADYFDGEELVSISTTSKAGTATSFTLDQACETLRLSVTDPESVPLGGSNAYIVRVKDANGVKIDDITGKVNVTMRVRTPEAVTVGALFRSGSGDEDFRTERLTFEVPGDTTAWTEFTLTFTAGDLGDFNPANLKDLWFYLDPGEDNFAGNEVYIDHIAIGGIPAADRYSPCSLEPTANAGVFSDYFQENFQSAISTNNTAGKATTFILDTVCETLSLTLFSDGGTATLPSFNAYQVGLTDENGEQITDLSGRVKATFRVRSAEAVNLSVLFRSGGGGRGSRTEIQEMVIPGGLDNWTEVEFTFADGELAGFDPTDARDLWFYLDRGVENFAGDFFEIDHIVVGGDPDSLLDSPCEAVGVNREPAWATGLSVYPNPTDGKILVELPNQLIAAKTTIGLVNALGQELPSGNIDLSPGRAVILMENLSAGTYFLVITAPSGERVVRPVVKR